MSVFQHSWKLILSAGVAGFVPCLATTAVASAEDEKPAAKATEEKPAEEKAEEKAADKDEAKADKDEEADRYAVPKDASAEELVAFIQKVQSVRVRSQEEYDAHRKKLVPAVREAAAKVMELEKDDPKSENYQAAQFAAIAVRLPDLLEGSEEESREILAATTELLSSKEPGDIARNDLALGSAVARYLEMGGKYDLAKQALTSFGEIYGKAAEKNEALKPLVESMAASLRRVNLPGNEIEIKGKTVDGKDFDWKAYSKGKVVLVDFWATWCGPCIAELPNVKKNYEKYHEKGFDVVGISLDTDREKLEEFLETEGTEWAQLFEDGAGWKHPVAVHYGIQGIPTVILVDQQGKVVSLNARGPELGRLLEKLLGSDGSASNEGDDEAKKE